MNTYIVFDMTTASPISMYTAEAPDDDGVSSDGRTLVHAILDSGVSPGTSQPQLIDGVWHAVAYQG